MIYALSSTTCIPGMRMLRRLANGIETYTCSHCSSFWDCDGNGHLLVRNAALQYRANPNYLRK